jgi:DNA primase
MATPVEQIKARLSIVEVVGSYLKLEKAGSSYKALCPFHHEKSPSFHVSPARDAYYCFGCNRGGDIFTFTEEIEGIPFQDALRMLAERAGVELVQSRPEDRGERERLLDIMEAATVFYQKKLVAHGEAMAYLHKRGLTPETMKHFRLGFAPADWHECRDHLRERGFTESEINKAGITKPGERGEYDRFRSRIMFPINDSGGHVVAFSGRIFGNDIGPDGSPIAKYINSPETPLYDKSSILFGYDRARSVIRKQNFTIVVEGQMDLLMAHQAGSENTVAVSGTALTEKHLGLLKRLSDNIVFAFDADDAGMAATRRAFDLALRVGLGVRVAAMPEGKDPADVVLKSPELWMKAVAESSHIVDFYITQLSKRGYNPREYRTEVERQVLPLVLAIPSKIEQAHFIVEIARKLGVPENAVWEEAIRMAQTLPQERGAPSSPAAGPVRGTSKSFRRMTEEAIWGILFWQEAVGDPMLDIVLVKTRYRSLMDEHGVLHYVPSPEEERELAIRAEHSYEHTPVLKDTVDEMLDTLESEVLKERQSDIWQKIAEAETKGDKEAMAKYTQAYQEITPRRIEIENRKAARGKPENK